jgi:hypothetical protein
VNESVPPGSAAWYVYGIVPGGKAQPSKGVASRPVEAVDEGEVAALVSVVPLEEFGEEPLRAHLNDRGWLEETARAHEQVLESALASSPVIPFRLCTIYQSRERVQELLARQGPFLAELLHRLEGKVELGVKAYFTPAERSEGTPEEGDSESGRAYLLRRQAERRSSVEAEQFRAACAQASHERLAAVATEARANPPQQPELSGRNEAMLLNGAYLVERDDRRIHDVVDELHALYGESGVAYEVTGPWPPYNFVPREILSQ